MKAVIVAGVLFLCLIVLFVGMLLPDTFEAFALSKVATYAEDMKRERIIDSPEYGILEVENDGAAPGTQGLPWPARNGSLKRRGVS